MKSSENTHAHAQSINTSSEWQKDIFVVKYFCVKKCQMPRSDINIRRSVKLKLGSALAVEPILAKNKMTKVTECSAKSKKKKKRREGCS